MVTNTYKDKTVIALRIAQESYFSESYGAGLLSGDVAGVLNAIYDSNIEHKALTNKLHKWSLELQNKEGFNKVVSFIQNSLRDRGHGSMWLSVEDVAQLIALASNEKVSEKDIRIYQ